jgi:hypothetical protein
MVGGGNVGLKLVGGAAEVDSPENNGLNGETEPELFSVDEGLSGSEAAGFNKEVCSEEGLGWNADAELPTCFGFPTLADPAADIPLALPNELANIFAVADPDSSTFFARFPDWTLESV